MSDNFEFEVTANSTYFILHEETVMHHFFVFLLHCCLELAEFSQKLDQTKHVGKGDTAETEMSAHRVRDQSHSMTY